jgi:hypothetical protein
VSFGGFDCFLLLVVVGARKKLGSTLINPTPNFYVDVVALSSIWLKSSSIIFPLKTILLR